MSLFAPCSECVSLGVFKGFDFRVCIKCVTAGLICLIRFESNKLVGWQSLRDKSVMAFLREHMTDTGYLEAIKEALRRKIICKMELDVICEIGR